MLGGTIEDRYMAKMYKTCQCGLVHHVPTSATLDFGSFYDILYYGTEPCSCGRFWVWKK